MNIRARISQYLFMVCLLLSELGYGQLDVEDKTEQTNSQQTTMENKALLIIDMQKDADLGTNPTEVKVIKNINELSGLFRNHGLTVIHIQHNGKGAFEKGTPGFEIMDDIQTEESDIYIEKTAHDSFYQTDLTSKLEELHAKDIYITGSATDFCIDATVHSALSKDYNVKVVADGHITQDKNYLTADQIIEHYNLIWDNLIPTKGHVQVKSLQEIREGFK